MNGAAEPSGEAREAARFAVEYARGLRERMRAQLAAVERAREALRAEILAPVPPAAPGRRS